MTEKTLAEQSGIINGLKSWFGRVTDPFGGQPLDLSNSNIPCGGYTRAFKRDIS